NQTYKGSRTKTCIRYQTNLFRLLGKGSFLLQLFNLESMQFEYVIGIDVSKLTLDIALVTQDAEVENFKIENKKSSIKKFFEKLSRNEEMSKVLICAEYTGHYCYPLRKVCLDQGYLLWLEGGAEIKQRS